MDRSLKIEIKPNETVPCVTVMHMRGDMGSESIGTIEKSFKQLVESRQLHVIAELSGVLSFSSSALGELMGGRITLMEQGGNLVLSGMSLELATKMNMLGAHKIFTIHNDLRSALAAFSWHFDNQPEKIECSYPPQLRLTPAVRHFIGRVVKQKGFSDRDAFRIETIIDEVCNNAVEHGSVNLNHTVDVTVSVGRQKVEVKVTNKNDPEKIENFKALSTDIFKAPLPPADDRRGRGLSLVKMLSDTMAFDFCGDGTTVNVTKLKREE